MTLSYDNMAGDLGITNMTRTAYRRQITKTLRKLEDRYGLVECEFEYNGPATVKLSDRTDGARIDVPSAYWDYGWSRSLGLAAKFAYLVCIYKTDRSNSKPSWTESLTELAEEFDIDRSTIGKGLRALAAEGLLRIEHSSVTADGFADRQANEYLLNPLPSPHAREKQWADMIAAHGKSAFERARELAALMGQERSPGVVADFLEIIDQYGYAWVESATREVAKKKGDNPQRHFGYIVGILRNWEKQGH